MIIAPVSLVIERTNAKLFFFIRNQMKVKCIQNSTENMINTYTVQYINDAIDIHWYYPVEKKNMKEKLDLNFNLSYGYWSYHI